MKNEFTGIPCEKCSRTGLGKNGVCASCWHRNTAPRVASPPKQSTVQAACCPVCGAQEEVNDLGYCPPIELHLCTCEHYACARCVKHCADGGCANTVCGDCAVLCEGCAEVQCADHVVAKNYCRHCCPADVRNEAERPAYVYED